MQHRQPLSIAYRPLRDLIPDARNARSHTAAQIKKIRASLARYGWANPILVGSGLSIIAGHARHQAAIAMAEEGQAIARNDDPWSAPTVDLSALSPTEQRAYILTDNRIAEDAGWDRDLLRIEIRELNAQGFDLGLTGFSEVQLDTLLGDPTKAAPALAGGLKYQVVIDCLGEAQQTELLAEMRQRQLPARPLIL